MSGRHAKLSPSAASRWMTCSMAPTLESTFPEQTSPYAEEGTRAHACAENAVCDLFGWPLKNDTAPDDREMKDAAEFYANYIKEAYLELDGQGACPAVFLEQRLDLTGYIPEGFGTADCLIVADGVLQVIDFKYGKGVEVKAENNLQMMIYAVGALGWARLMYDVDTVKMTIIQPRLGGVSSSELKAADLDQWAINTLRPIAEEAWSGTGSFHPSEEACRFCRASGSCKAQADYFLELFDEAEPVALLTLKEKGNLLLRAAGLTAWLKALEDGVYEGLMAGEEVPGWKLVEGKSNRKYTDETKIYQRLKAKRYKTADLFEKKLIGITKMEKLLGKQKMAELIGDLIEKPAGRPTLAPADDKRPAIKREDDIVKAFDEE